MPEPHAPFFTAGQRRLIGFAAALFALLATAAMLAAVVAAAGRLIAVFAGVLWPLAVAGILALILRPAVEAAERRLRLGRTAAVALLFAVFLVLVAGLLLLVIPPLLGQLLDFIAYAPTLWANVLGYVQRHYPAWVDLAHRQLENPTVRQFADGLLAEGRLVLAHALPSLRAAGSGLLGLFHFAASAAVVPIYLFFFLLARGEPLRRLPDHLGFLRPGQREDVVFLLREFVAIVVAFFRGQLLIGLIMGVLLAIGFSAVGLKFGLFLGLALGILNIVPYLGTIIGLSSALPLAFFQAGGGWERAGLVLLVFVCVQAAEGWFLTPRIMGRTTGLHPAVIIVAIFFWGTALGGILGMMLAVPLTAFGVTAWRLLRRKYLAPEPASGQALPPSTA